MGPTKGKKIQTVLHFLLAGFVYLLYDIVLI